MILLLALVALPALAALAAYLTPNRSMRLGVLVGTALAHTGLTALLWSRDNNPGPAGWLQADALGLMVLAAVSLLFLATAVYTVGFLRLDRPRGGRIFVTCLLAFLAACTLVALAHHLALFWIGMEATTLAIAPLVFHHRDRRSLEAVWKYLVLSSVGIACGTRPWR